MYYMLCSLIFILIETILSYYLLSKVQYKKNVDKIYYVAIKVNFLVNTLNVLCRHTGITNFTGTQKQQPLTRSVSYAEM